jgi:hypothetical protein
LKELEKLKVRIGLADLPEWMAFFEAQKGKAQELKKQIENTDMQIDGMVYTLYDLTPDEVQIVEGAKS